MKAYVVVWGSSGCDALVVFTSGEIAEKYVKESKGVPIENGEWIDFLKTDLDPPESEWFLTCVRMDSEGKVSEVFKWPNGTIPHEEGFNYYDFHSNMLYCVKTTEKEEAIREANLKRGILLLYNAWGDMDKTRDVLKKLEEEEGE